MANPVSEPLFPSRRPLDQRPIDSVDRSPAALAAMPPLRRVLTHPALLWLPVLVLFTAGQLVLLVAFLVLGEDPANEARLGWTSFIASMIGYALVLVVLERRRPRELTRHPWQFLLAGVLLGAVLLSLTVGVIHGLGGLEWGPPSTDVRWAWWVLAIGIGPAIGEELIFRGIVFRYVEQGLGTWVALLLSAAFFGAAHLGNPSATIWSAAAIAIEAGIMLGVLYALTRSLWLVIGVHLAWNLTQGLVFGSAVSGIGLTGWLSPTPVGDPLLSGGAFGVEASIVALIVCSVVSVVGLVLLVRRDGIVHPAWMRRAAIQRSQSRTAAVHSDR